MVWVMGVPGAQGDSAAVWPLGSDLNHVGIYLLGCWEFKDTHVMGTRKVLSEERKTKEVEETGRERLWSQMQAGSDSTCLSWLKEVGSGPLYLGLEMRV